MDDVKKGNGSMKRIFKKYWFYILAFFLPVVIILIHSWVADTWLTGNGSILRGDMKGQLVPFYYALWDKVHAGENLSYTWNLCGGMDFHSILGYLISPFTLLILIFPRNWIVNMVQLTMVIKLALVAVSMTYYFYCTKYNTLKFRKEIVSLFLGLAFTLGNGMLNFLGYIQFNDVMICFPILLLLIERMVDAGKWKLYYLILTFCMISNLYLTYLVCIFLLLWFGFQMTGSVEKRVRKIFIFAGSSILSALTMCYSIFDAIMLNSGRYGGQSAELVKKYLFETILKPRDFVKQFFILTPIPAANSLSPNIFLSLSALVIACFLPVVKLRKRQKLYLAVLSIFMIASYFSGALSYIWHLFSVPNGVYHRFTNFFVFLILFLALMVLSRLEDIKTKHVIGIGVILLTVIVAVFFQLEKFNSVYSYLFTALLVILYILLFFFCSRKRILYKNMILVMVCFGMIELCINSYYALENYDARTYWDGFKADLFTEQMEADYGERTAWSQLNVNFGLSISQWANSGFISGLSGDNLAFHQYLGMPTNGRVSVAICGASPLINLMLNIRYGIGISDMEFSDAEEVYRNGDYKLYRMKRLAGLGYMVDSDIQNWDITDGTNFEVQNSFINCAAKQEDIFAPVDTDMVCNNALGETIPIMHPEWTGEGTYLYNYKCKYGTELDSLVAEFTMEKDEDLYIYSQVGGDMRFILIYVDGECCFNGSSYELQTYHVGNLKKGQKVTMYAVPVNSSELSVGTEIMWKIRLAAFDEQAYEKAYEVLSKNVYEIQTGEDDYIKGTIQAEKDGIMMTSIQAQEGFQVYVDGNREDYVTIGGTMIGVPLKAGRHTVEFKYKTPVFMPGRFVSAGAVIVFVIICLVDWWKKRLKQETAETEA